MKSPAARKIEDGLRNCCSQRLNTVEITIKFFAEKDDQYTGRWCGFVCSPKPTVEATVEVTVGALAVANPSGSVIDPATGLPWGLCGLRLRRGLRG